MNIVKHSHFIPSASFIDDFLSKDVFNHSGRSNEPATVPGVNIIESDDFFRVEMAAPGMEKDHFEISLDHNTLTISSDLSQHELKPNDQAYTRREFSYLSFKRSFHLPRTVDSEKIEASYTNGILNLVLPKKEEARKKPVRTIHIS